MDCEELPVLQNLDDLQPDHNEKLLPKNSDNNWMSQLCAFTPSNFLLTNSPDLMGGLSPCEWHTYETSQWAHC
jgi:hypothetical protein